MRFGMSEEEAEAQPSRGGSGSFMKYPKAGDNVVRILDEPDKWVYYWEHFNPGGFSFPCTNERDTCPGCTSDNEKMKKASHKVAMNCFDGQYTNVWKFPKKSVADKLKSRWERIGTITDRDYLITQIKSPNSVDYDVEGQDKEPINLADYEEYLTDPEILLAQAYEDSWGDDAKVREAKVNVDKGSPEKTQRPKIERTPAPEPEEPAWAHREEKQEEKVVTEEELRKMDADTLADLCIAEGFGKVPKDCKTPGDIVDWMLSQ